MRYLTTIPLKLKTSSAEVELKSGDTFTPKNEDAIRGLLAGGKIKPLQDVMLEKYTQIVDWLYQFDLGKDEIKEMLPGLYMDIQDAIERMDNAFVIEDLPAFQDNLERIRQLYVEALFKCGREVAIKVYSEVLQGYLWVVADNKDMKALRASQGLKEAIYTTEEIKKLKSLDKDSLKENHRVKEVFEDSKIESVLPKVEE